MNTSKNSTFYLFYWHSCCWPCFSSLRNHLCGYDLNLTYPQTGGYFPSFNLNFSSPGGAISRSSSAKSLKAIASYITELEAPTNKKRSIEPRHVAITREKQRRAWKKAKRDLSGRANGTIDPWYGCFLGDEVQDYALNFSLPWSESHKSRWLWNIRLIMKYLWY